MKIAINGFGRIGKALLRVLNRDFQANKHIEVVALNVGPAEIAHTAHLFKYDTIMGTYPGTVSMEGTSLVIDNNKIALYNIIDPAQCPWKSLGVDWVVDCSGKFTNAQRAQAHLAAGAKAVLISAPAHGEDIAIIPGVNDRQFDATKHKIVSLGSCTTNALLPLLKVINDAFGIEQAFMTTVHAYTNTQALLDIDCKDLRRARAAALNIIPTSSGAGSMIDKVMPELIGKVETIALRVPVGDVSLIDLTFTAKKNIDAASINNFFARAAQSTLKGIIGYTQDHLVSSDFIGNNNSVVIDSLLTQAQGFQGKLFGWYDNEWGYSQRLKDFLLSI